MLKPFSRTLGLGDRLHEVGYMSHRWFQFAARTEGADEQVPTSNKQLPKDFPSQHPRWRFRHQFDGG